MSFIFNYKTKLSESSVYRTSKGAGKHFFTQQSLEHADSFLIKNCVFTIANLVFKQDIGIPMGIQLAPFWANLFLYFLKSKYVKNVLSLVLPRAYKYHGGIFTDDLCDINNSDEFFKSFKNIYPKESEMTMEHNGINALVWSWHHYQRQYFYI